MAIYLKHFSIKTVMAFLFGIGGLLLIFYLCVLTNIGDLLDFVAGCKTLIFIAILIGHPIGSSIGILIAKKYFLKSDKNLILCLIVSMSFSLLAGPLLILFALFAEPFLGPLLVTTGEILYFPLISVIALLGDSLAEKWFNKSTQ